MSVRRIAHKLDHLKGIDIATTSRNDNEFLLYHEELEGTVAYKVSFEKVDYSSNVMNDIKKHLEVKGRGSK